MQPDQRSRRLRRPGDGEDAAEGQHRAVRPLRVGRAQPGAVLREERPRCSASSSAASTGRSAVPVIHRSTASSPASTCRYVVSQTSTAQPQARPAGRVGRPARATPGGARSPPASVSRQRGEARQLGELGVAGRAEVARHLEGEPAAGASAPTRPRQQVKMLGHPLQGRVGHDHVHRLRRVASREVADGEAQPARAGAGASSIISGEVSSPRTSASGQRSASVAVRLPGPQPEVDDCGGSLAGTRASRSTKGGPLVGVAEVLRRVPACIATSNYLDIEIT